MSPSLAVLDRRTYQPIPLFGVVSKTNLQRQASSGRWEFRVEFPANIFSSVSKPIYKSKKEQLLIQLDEIYSECSSADWDNEGALPLNKKSYHAVRDFLKILPGHIALPEITPEPNGSLGLEWDQNGYHMALSICKDHQLVYAIISKTSRNSGTILYGGFFPDEVMFYLERISA